MSKLRYLILLLLGVILLYSCGKVFMTGRQRVLLYNDGEIASLSKQSYEETLSKSTLSTNSHYKALITEVGLRITKAVDQYLAQNGLQNDYKNVVWKFDVIKSPEINAYALPSGNIVFYEGIMEYANTPDYVAVVMGHEIAHVLAKHGNERISEQAVLSNVGNALGNLISKGDYKKRALFNVAFGLGAKVGVILPYSRQHEYEADKIGLNLMALAGYDITKAPQFWEKMSAGKVSKSDFFSTHPSDNKRITKLKEAEPEARKYNKAK